MGKKTPQADGDVGESKILDDVFGLLGTLASGFHLYVREAKQLLFYPTVLASGLTKDDRRTFRAGLQFLCYGIVASYILLIPVFLEYPHDVAFVNQGESVSKLTFFLRLLMQFVLYATAFHFGLRLWRARTVALKRTIGVYSFVLGLGVPLLIILDYPLLLLVGPGLLFGRLPEAATLVQAYPWLPGYAGVLYDYQLLVLIANFLFYLFLFMTIIPITHGLPRPRVLLGGLSSIVPLFFIQASVINPTLNALFEWLGGALNLM